MENPRDVHEDLREDLEINGSDVVVVHGQVHGDVFVRGSATFILHGIVRGNVWIENRGIAYVHGIVLGDITNNGGTLKHYGMIKGKLNRLSGETVVHSKALVCEGKE